MQRFCITEGSKWAVDSKQESLKTLQENGSAIKGRASQCDKVWQGPHLLEERPFLGAHLPTCDNPVTDCLLPAMHSQGAELVQERVAKATAVKA